jgi:hypothetical protein
MHKNSKSYRDVEKLLLKKNTLQLYKRSVGIFGTVFDNGFVFDKSRFIRLF